MHSLDMVDDMGTALKIRDDMMPLDLRHWARTAARGRAAVRGAVDVPVVLEGGAGSLEHLDEAVAAGADGVAVETLLVFSGNNLVRIKRYLMSQGRPMRRP